MAHTYLLIVLGGAYLVLVMRVYGLLKRSRPPERKPLNFFSVIISARNEGKRLIPLISSLEGLNYPVHMREIIFVDDASEDDTAGRLEQAAGRIPGARLLRISADEREQNGGGKKNAVHRAIMESSGPFIAVTDADCAVPADWLLAFNNTFDEQTVMVLGHSLIRSLPGFINKLLRFDNLFAGLVSAIPAMLGMPLSSVGRSMAYRREAYLRSGGYPHMPASRSGDDVFLTERFRQLELGAIRFCTDPNAFVETLPPDDLKEIFWQQVRKNSKLIHKSGASWGLTLFLFTFHLLLFAGFYSESVLPVALSIAGLKWIAEFMALRRAAFFFAEKDLIPWLPFFELFYPFYIIFFALLGLAGIYRWKS